MSRSAIKSFRDACGLNGPLRVGLEDGDRSASRTFELPFFVAGGSPGADLVLEDGAVSRRHAYFQVIDGRLFCVDLGSRTGVHWVRGPEPSGWVDDRLGVLVGPFRIVAGEDAGPAPGENPLASRSLGDSPLPAVTLEFPTMAGQPPWRASRVLTLMGRAPACRLRWENPSISKFHCALLRVPAGIWVIDLFGRGGIEVNGERVRWARLEYGDQVQVGPYRVRLRKPGSSADDVSSDPASGVWSLMVTPPRSGWPATLSPPGAGDPPTPASRATLPVPLVPPEVVAEHRDDPVALKAELVEPLMAQLASQCGQMQQQMFDQFGQMQQQMFDQFQQAMMMMAQMFGNLHRDQLALIREEVDRLRQLNQDLHALQVQAQIASPPPAPPMPAALTTSDDTVNTLARIEAMLLAAQPGPVPAPPVNPPAATSMAVPGPETALSASPEGPGGISSLAPETPASEPLAAPGAAFAPPPASSPAGPAPDRPSGLPGDDIHAHLWRRIATLQQERQTRWQRLLNLMMNRA